jgi:periplasmic protein CpxP/Spy|tara:strand:- start:669 stop:1043 length:375 start_codon:yes stop_codon:yes gene_type:complete
VFTAIRHESLTGANQMRNSNIKLSITAAIFAGSVAFFSVFAHAEGKVDSIMNSDSGDSGMMSSKDMKGMDGMKGMKGMEGMEGMMSNMSEEERKAMKNMKKACMKMMQSHGSDHMDRGEKDKDA